MKQIYIYPINIYKVKKIIIEQYEIKIYLQKEMHESIDDIEILGEVNLITG